jgi:hypothetical protein
MINKETPSGSENFVMDFDKLSELTGKSLTDIADELDVDKSFISNSKIKPKIMNRIMVSYMEKFEKVLPLKDLFIPEPQNNNQL